ncbi:MAG: hypothetical protein IKA64_02715 [Clostridia bacterium]|nr:hypothetical protein [Clostridia bacterium]
MEIIDENSRGFFDFRRLSTFRDQKLLDIYEEDLRKKLSNSSNARWDLALTIARLFRSGAWCAFYAQTQKLYNDFLFSHFDKKGLSSSNPYYPIGGNWSSSNMIVFFTFLREKFGLCRTTVYNYLEVVDEFTTYIDDEGKEPEYKINFEATNFQFWQLIEMTSLTYKERLKVQPNWTREEIRAYKKSLREKKKGKIQPAEQVEAEEKPLTEEQQRFAKYSKDDLIKLVVELEKACESKESEIERIILNPVTPKNVLPLKQDLTSIIEKLLKSYDYEIHLNKRKQGAKAFAGVLAKRIIESCNSDNVDSPLIDSVDGDVIQEKFAV